MNAVAQINRYTALAAAHRELEELKEENIRLKELLFPPKEILYHGVGVLSRKEHLLLQAILDAKGSFCSRQHANDLIYYGLDEPDGVVRVIDVMMSKLRKKLTPEQAATIETINGRGWRISAANRTKFVPL